MATTKTTRKPATVKVPPNKTTLTAVRKDEKPEQLEFNLDAALDDMDEKFVYCRDVMHAWQPYTARQEKDGTFTSTLKCARCETYKVRILSRRGAILSSYYDYPEGYCIVGAGRLTGTARDTIRLRSLRNVMAQLDTMPGSAAANA